MKPAIEYQKIMTEIVYINLPGPEAPNPGMSGGELFHGFLADLYKTANPEARNCLESVGSRWNVFYRNQRK